LPNFLIHSSFSAFGRLAGRNGGTIAQIPVALSAKVEIYGANRRDNALGALLTVVNGAASTGRKI
jgi:hypothetical protein